MPTTFAPLGVPDEICRALARRGITEAFEIQAATIADSLAGRDVSGRAPTGSGKTLAFGVPLVATVDQGRSRRPRGLILSPTRELADQIAAELDGLSDDVRIGVVYGGVGYRAQLAALRRGVDLLVACPGRLEDLIEQGAVDLGDVDRVVIDEADRMADMGFLPSVRRLLAQTASRRQTVLFSATLDGDVATLVRDHQHDPVRHEVGSRTPDVRSATHVFWSVTREDRLAVCASAVESAWPAIVFCRTRHGADRVARQLAKFGVDAVALHGGRSQNQRTRALDDFTRGRVQALVATDVAARGIHVDGVASVIHFDPPEDDKAYIHRSGRTARAGESGLVVSLVQPDQRRVYRELGRGVGIDTDVTEPPAPASPRPRTERSSKGQEPARRDDRPKGGRGSTRPAPDSAPSGQRRRRRSSGSAAASRGKGGGARRRGGAPARAGSGSGGRSAARQSGSGGPSSGARSGNRRSRGR